MYLDSIIKTVSKRMELTLNTEQFTEVKTLVANWDEGVDLNNVIPVVTSSISTVVEGNTLFKPSAFYNMVKNENPIMQNDTKCPSCQRYMVDARLTNSVDVNYCQGCRIVLPVKS